jgi:hypothetical protein
MRQLCIAATAAILLTAAPHLRAADGPYIAAGYAVTGFKTLCDGDACDRHDGGFRAAAGWGFAKYLTVEALYLHAGHFVAGNVTSDGTAFHGTAKVTGYGGTVGFEIPLPRGLSLGGRLGGASMKADFRPGPAPAIAGGMTTTQLLAGVTARWQFADHWSLRADWDHTRARMNRFDGDVNAGTIGFQFGF